MKKKTIIIASSIGAVALVGVTLAVEEYRAQRMINYAHEHNCKWYNAENYQEAVCR